MPEVQASVSCLQSPASVIHSANQEREKIKKEWLQFKEVGRRGAIKTEEALRKLLVKDIADGYFGQEVIHRAPSIIDQAGKVYRKLTEEDNE